MRSRACGGIAALIVGVVVQTAAAGPHRWTPTGPVGGYGTLVAYDPATPGAVYAAVSGRLVRSADGGATWTLRDDGLPKSLFLQGVDSFAIDPGNPSTLVAVSYDRLFRSTDQGVTWSYRSIGDGQFASDGVVVSHPLAPGTFWVITFAGSIRQSTDGGDTWTPLGVRPGPFESVLGFALDPAAPSTFYVLMFQSGVPKLFRSTNSGASWTAGGAGLPVASVSNLVVAATNPTTLYVKASASLFRSRDGGATWSQTGLGRTDIMPLAADPSNPITLYGRTTGLVEEIVKSTDDGATWTPLDVHAPQHVAPSVIAMAVDPGDSSRVVAGTLNGVLRSGDGGATWALGQGELSRLLVFFQVLLEPGTSTRYACEADTLWKSTDDGLTWTPRNPEPVVSNYVHELVTLAMDPTASSTLYLGTSRRGVFKSTDGAASWTPTSSGLGSLDVQSLAVDPLTPSVVYAAAGGSLYRSVDGGASWNLRYGLDPIDHIVVDPATPVHLYANKGGLVSTDGGLTFDRPAFLPPDGTFDAFALDPTDSLVVYLVRSTFTPSMPPSFEATLYKSTDGLVTGAATYGGTPSGAPYSIWSVGVNPAFPSTVWAGIGSQPFAMLESRDGADTFTLQGAGLTILPLEVNSAAAESIGITETGTSVFVATSGFGIFRRDEPPCATAGDCDDGDDCSSDTCDTGRCSHAHVATGTVCVGPDTCGRVGQCDASGRCYRPSPVCDDGNSATGDLCLISDTCGHFQGFFSTTTTTTLCQDPDGDTVCAPADNCPSVANPTQRNLDGDPLGDACDPDDAPLSLGTVKLRAGAGTGRATVKGRIVLGAGDTLDLAAGLTVAVADGLTASASHAWAAADCVPQRNGVRCRSVDRKQQARFSREGASLTSYRVRIRLKLLTLPTAFGAPAVVTVSEAGSLVDRRGTIASCSSKPGSLSCRE